MKDRTPVTLTLPKHVILEYSDGLADVLCWIRGFVAACPEDTKRHPLNIDLVSSLHSDLKEAMRKAGEE